MLAAEQRSAQAQRHSAKLQQQNAALREDATASKQLAARLREQLARPTPCGLPVPLDRRSTLRGQCLCVHLCALCWPLHPTGMASEMQHLSAGRHFPPPLLQSSMR